MTGTQALVTIAAAASPALVLAAFWRYVWFFRNPQRRPPDAPGIVSPADGTVVYARKVGDHEEVISIKQGRSVAVRDLLREDAAGEKLVIGIFMSPLDVHYNRAPLDATLAFIKRYPALDRNLHMGSMHARILLGRRPYYAKSPHIVENERAVTCFEGTYAGRELTAYVVQIGARTVNGIDSYFHPGDRVKRGETFGMIRIGSQVDLVLPWRSGLDCLVQPGDRVRAGESILVR